MVTFSIPGDSELVESVRSTPRPRPPLPFAKRAYVSSPFTNKRLGTPQSAPSRRLLTTRDEVPSSSLTKSSIATARNIFRASTISDSPNNTFFSPSLPQSTMKKVFAPGATPEPNRTFRESTAHPTPRGMATKVTSKELFPLRIEDPDPELSGEVLARKVPKDWNAKGSIYADQYLAHLCPHGFDDEQRRQFFCILDLRRLKYAANEIFLEKDWKLNIINFAKEFEKSRSLILLRYGLYEFHNVKPSKDVLKRWRREHGLPDPEEEEDAAPTPTKATSSKKRKADEDLSKDASLAATKNKRRAAEMDEEEQSGPTSTPALNNKNKRKASVSEEVESQPSKMQKSTPSAAKSLFEKIANKSSTPAGSPVKAASKTADTTPAAKPNPFAPNKTNGGGSGLARSVFQHLQPGTAQGSGNIFGYLSDASSAKNSGVDADAESETDSDAEQSQETGQSDEPSAAASGADTASQIGSTLFGNKPAPTSAPVAGESSAPGTRESTPGRSLFDRVTKNSEGQPVRLDDRPEPEAAPSEKAVPKPVDQTWNPSTTPIKFAPTASSTQPASLFGNGTPASSSSVFGSKPPTTSSIFGAPKAAEKVSLEAITDKDKSGGESDKENDEAPKKSLFEAKAPATQSSVGSSLFQPKPAADAPKPAEPAKLISNLFGAPKSDDKSATPAANLFGSISKPTEAASTPTAPVLQSSSLFGAKPAEAAKPVGAPSASSLFGGSSATPNSTDAAATGSLFGAKPTGTGSTATGSLFGAKPTSTATPTTSNIFGGASSAPATKPLFGAAGSTEASTPKTDSSAAPIFSFAGGSAATSKPNGASEPASKPLFGVPMSPSSSAPAFEGSPMKQDGPSPVKRAFNGGDAGAASAAPIFSFGAASSTPSAPIFGGASSTPASGAGSSSNVGFSFGSSTTGFNNPFASGNSGSTPAFGSASTSAPGGMFNFGSGTAPAASGSTSSPFQFGGTSTSAPAPAFGGNQTSSTPSMFGGAPTGGAPGFNFTGASSQPSSGTFTGSNQPAPAFGNLQPPAGGASTTGTNTPFSLGGGSSLATTPAGGTPEPSAPAQGATGGNDEEGEKHEQISLTDGLEADEEILHDVRAKVLKFVPATEKSDDKPKSKSPWSIRGVGPLRLLKHKETNAVRLLLRAEPRGNVALNRMVLPNMSYKAEEKYVKMTTSNETGDGLETWMVQVKTKDLAKELAEALEKHKALNGK